MNAWLARAFDVVNHGGAPSVEGRLQHALVGAVFRALGDAKPEPTTPLDEVIARLEEWGDPAKRPYHRRVWVSDE